jgi:diguanylate cyclase (GGDEF)-like protein
MTLLVIDANDNDREQICELLRGWGYHSVRACSDLEEATDLLALDEAPKGKALYGLELVLLDLTQGAPYPSFIQKIHNVPAYADIPILALSEGQRQERMSTAFAYGAHDFVSKPIEAYELKSRLRSCLKLKYEIDRRKAREHELIEATHQLSDLNQILSMLSLMDSLTGIPNRRCFDDTLEQEWRRAQRHSGELTIIMLDIDYFKQFNDTYGHQKGDQCLRSVAKAIQEELRRPGDLLARYGGEEFSIILPNTNAAQSEPLCQKILDAVRRIHVPHETSKVADHVTVSMGVASTDPQHSTLAAAELVQYADEALYEAKTSGRNRYSILTPPTEPLAKAEN